MFDGYIRHPINKTAATVTSQKGCSKEELTPEQERENLVAKKKALVNELIKCPKNSPERKELARQVTDVEAQIHAIRPKKKAPGVENYIMDILREDLTKAQFNSLMTRAIKRMQENFPCNPD
jgi:hypothetical protein